MAMFAAERIQADSKMAAAGGRELGGGEGRGGWRWEARGRGWRWEVRGC